MDEKYVRVPIFPLVRYLTPKESIGWATRKEPRVFDFCDSRIRVVRTLDCQKAVSLKAGGGGYRFVCMVNWGSDDAPRIRESVIWYDEFYDDWFVEVLESWAEKHGVEYEKYRFSAEKQ